MRYLLDTQVLLWLFVRSQAVDPHVRAVLADPANLVYASAVSTWEIAVKAALGKVELPGNLGHYVPDRIARAGLTVLPIVPAHTLGVLALPAHHRDPFDRLLVAQAQAEAMILVTNDRIFEEYDVMRLMT
jgi:PIN domain nuclease of toxin-antitoxin system